MFNVTEFNKTKSILSNVGPRFYSEESGQHHIQIRPKDLLKWIEFVKSDLDYLTLVDLVGVDHGESEYRFELIYHLLNMGNHQRINLHVHFNEDEIVPTVTHFFLHAEWLEREQKEMLDIAFDKEYDALLLPMDQANFPLRKNGQIKVWPENSETRLPALRRNPNKSEAPYPEESYVWKKFDIFSQETLGNFEWLVCFDPNKVVDSKVNIGFHHQGFEKLLEGKDWFQVLQLVDKIQIGSAPTYSIAWTKTLEDLLGIHLPERAQAIRIVMLELGRIAEHLTVLSEVVYALGKEEFKLFINAREKVYELFEKYCGHRQGMGIARLGGLREDLPHGWIVEYQAIAEILKSNLNIIHQSLVGQKGFRENLSFAPVNAQTVLQWGVSGPAMRAAGLNFDLRKSRPFYFYQDIDFDIPIGIHGSSYDRYLVRYEEIHQSLRIITQVLDNLPLGVVTSPDYAQSFFNVKEILPEQRHWHYSGLEAPNGEAGFFLFPTKDLHPYRVKIKSPSFTLAQALPQFVIGLEQSQLAGALASLGIRRFEMDR